MSHCAQATQELPAWRRSSAEEFANATTHGLGLLLALIGTSVVLPIVLAPDDSWINISSLIYLASLVAVFAMSTFSHMASSVRWKSFFRKYDQAFIYLLIVATYTPFSLAYLNGGVWSILLLGMWSVAVVGFVGKTFFAYRVETVSISSYVILGWMSILAVPAIWRSAPALAFDLMIAGSAFYMMGTWFLANDERGRYFHAVWHLLVIAGSACHFVAIFRIVNEGRI
jgi:hemolysin III